MFRRTFGSEDGRIALSYILDDLCYFTPPTNAEDQARRTYATRLLHERLGITDNIACTTAMLNTIKGKE